MGANLARDQTADLNYPPQRSLITQFMDHWQELRSARSGLLRRSSRTTSEALTVATGYSIIMHT